MGDMKPDPQGSPAGPPHIMVRRGTAVHAPVNRFEGALLPARLEPRIRL